MRVKGGGTAGVLNRRAREGGERERGPITQHRRADYARPWISQGHGPSTQGTRMDNDTGRNKQRICTYECKRIADQGITTHGGAQNRYERTGRRTDADLCALRRTEQGNRSEVLPDVHGRSSKQREPPRNPATESDGAGNREQEQREKLRNRFGSTSSSPREIPSSSSSSSFYSS